MKKIIIALQLSLMLVSINVFSQTSEKTLIAKFLVEGGFEYGGDKIYNYDSGRLMKAGQGAYLAVGGQFELSKVKNFMLRVSIGYKYDRTATDNGNFRFTRIPVNLMPYFKVKEDFRFGIGIASHYNIKLKSDVRSDVSFTGSFGPRPRFEFGYKWITISYTLINYIEETDGWYSANSIGISGSFTFPKN